MNHATQRNVTGAKREIYNQFELTFLSRDVILNMASFSTRLLVSGQCSYTIHILVYANIDQTLMYSLHRLLNCEIGGLYCHVITVEYRTHVHYIHM